MKFDRTVAFPFPVLRPGSSDYEGAASFEMEADLILGAPECDLKVTFRLSQPGVLAAINSGKAAYVAVIEAADTLYHEILSSAVAECECKLPTGALLGDVVVHPFVVARKRIDSFAEKGIHPDFGGGGFSVEQGSVLCAGVPVSFFIDKEKFGPVTSVFEIVDGDIEENTWKLVYTEETVQIKMHPNTRRKVEKLRNKPTTRAILLNSIYFVAVTEGVSLLLEDSAAHEDSRWAKVFQQSCANKGINLEQKTLRAHEVAQILLRHPVAAVLKHFAEKEE